MPDNVTIADPVSAAPPATQGEHMIPKSRFDEINTRYQELTAKLTALEAEQKADIEKRLAEQNQWKELAEKRGAELADAQQKAAQVGEYEKALSDLLDKQIAEVPEEKRGLIPTYDTTKQRLEWIAQNRAILTAPQPFDIGAGRQGGGETKKIDLTPEELLIAQKFKMTPEDYAKFK